MNFSKLKIANTNSLRLFALFCNYDKADFSEKSVLHLFIKEKKTKNGVNIATISHIPFDDMNIIVSDFILQRIKIYILIIYVIFILFLMSSLFLIFGKVGVVPVILLFEKNIRKKILLHLSNKLQLYYKNEFFEYLKSRI